MLHYYRTNNKEKVNRLNTLDKWFLRDTIKMKRGKTKNIRFPQGRYTNTRKTSTTNKFTTIALFLIEQRTELTELILKMFLYRTQKSARAFKGSSILLKIHVYNLHQPT